MKPEEQKKLNELYEWMNSIKRQQLTLPIDVASIQALSQALIPSVLQKISSETGIFKKLNIGAGTTTQLTIDSGVINVTDSVHTIETEGGGATDDLDTINTDERGDGQILVLSAEDNGHTVVAKDGTGNLRLNGDFSMDHSRDRLVLIRRITTWYELCRSDNDA